MKGLSAVYKYYREHQDEMTAAIAGAKERNTEIGESRSVPFYLDGEILQGEDGVDLPEDHLILDHPPYGHLISNYQYDKI